MPNYAPVPTMPQQPMYYAQGTTLSPLVLSLIMIILLAL